MSVDSVSSPVSAQRAVRRAVSAEHGFTLMEAVLAMSIFLGVATALAGVLTSSISARVLSTQRTKAEQLANDQLEWVRSLDYADVGLTVNGNPKGLINSSGNQSAQGGPVVPAGFTATIRIFWIDDPVPTAFATKANYKNVVVTVFRASDSKLLSTQSTQVGPRQRAAFGGINKGIVNVQVQAYFTNTPLPNSIVHLDNGPSSPLADTTDGAGTVRFPSLDAATGATYYDLSVDPFGGYIQVPDPSVTHFQLAAGSTPSTKVLQMYKPVTLTVDFRKSDGTPFVGTVAFTVASSRGSKSYTYSGSPVTVATIVNSTTSASEQLVPGPYTITVTNQVASLFYTAAVTQNVPAFLSNYPTDLTATATLTALPTKALALTIQRNGANLANTAVAVSITGGPIGTANALPAYGGTFTTNASGSLPLITVPSGTGGYTIKANISNCALFTSYESGSVSGVSSTGTVTTSQTLNFSTSASPCPFTPLP